MNHRMQELAEKANIEFTYDPTEKPIRAFVECWEDELEKFAQLIVKECVAIANRQFSAATGLDDRDCLTAQQMKQHFGVER